MEMLCGVGPQGSFLQETWCMSGCCAGVSFLRANNLLPADDSSDDDVNYAEAAGVEW